MVEFSADKQRVLDDNYETMKRLNAENSSLMARIDRAKVLSQNLQDDISNHEESTEELLTSFKAIARDLRLKLAAILMKQRILQHCCRENGFHSTASLLNPDDDSNLLDDIDLAVKVNSSFLVLFSSFHF